MQTILVVDDETNIRMMVRMALQHEGYKVELASDGVDALERFSDGTGIDLVLLDQRMPGMEGLDVLREMRKRNPTAKVIMVTAYGTVDLAVQAMKDGANDFLRKPFTTETLRGAVAAALKSPQTEGETPAGITFGLTTINGFRIEFMGHSGKIGSFGFHQEFTLRSPHGDTSVCTVALPSYMLELVKAHADRDQMPGGERFWTALCEEALANYLWQNAEFPPNATLTVEDLTTSLKRFVDTVLAA